MICWTNLPFVVVHKSYPFWKRISIIKTAVGRLHWMNVNISSTMPLRKTKTHSATQCCIKHERQAPQQRVSLPSVTRTYLHTATAREINKAHKSDSTAAREYLASNTANHTSFKADTNETIGEIYSIQASWILVRLYVGPTWFTRTYITFQLCSLCISPCVGPHDRLSRLCFPHDRMHDDVIANNKAYLGYLSTQIQEIQIQVRRRATMTFAINSEVMISHAALTRRNGISLGYLRASTIEHGRFFPCR